MKTPHEKKVKTKSNSTKTPHAPVDRSKVRSGRKKSKGGVEKSNRSLILRRGKKRGVGGLVLDAAEKKFLP